MAGGSFDVAAAGAGVTRTGDAAAELVDDGAPAGYDDLVSRAAVYRDRSRRIFRVSGGRAADMLQGLITADIREPGDGAAWPTLILTPKGRVLADAVVVRVDDDLLLDVAESAWPGLEPHFGRYLPPRFASLEPTELDVLRVRGPDATARAGQWMPELASLPPVRHEEDDGTRWGALRLDDGYAIARDGAGGAGIDLLLPAPETPLPTASREAWEVWRIEQGIPLYGQDISEENLPQETGLVAETTSFSKGCYTGQEVLARIHYRGKVNRHLRGLRVPESRAGAAEEARAGTPPLAVGDELRQGDRVLGAVTSAVRSPRFGWIGLGYLRREVEPGDQVVVQPGGTDTSEDGRREVVARVVTRPFE